MTAGRSWWRRATALQRTAFVGFLGGFIAFVLSGLIIDGAPVEGHEPWLASQTALAAVLPLYAMLIGWWIGRNEDVVQPSEAPAPAAGSLGLRGGTPSAESGARRGVRSWRFPQRLAYILVFALFWTTRRPKGAPRSPAMLVELVWWLAAIAILAFVIPRLIDRRRGALIGRAAPMPDR